MKVEPYLELAGVELANALRTLTYLRRGLGGSAFTVSVAHPLVVSEGGGYSDVYYDEYAAYLDSYRTANLSCFCSVYDTGPYQDPAHDEAPWYDANRPESADFLGLVVEVSLTAVARRSVTARVGGGAAVGAVGLSPRFVQVQGAMYAASRAGMAYGERWLSRALTGTDGCGDDVLSILPACPPDDVEDGTTYLRQLAAVGVVDGPLFSPAEFGVPECYVQAIAFQLVAGDPYLRATTNLLAGGIDTMAEQCVDVVASAVASDAAAVLSFYAGPGELDGVVVTASIDGVTATFTVVEVPGGATLVIDSSRRIVEATDSDGTVVGGLDLVDFDGLFPWLVAQPGQTMTVCVDGTAGTVHPAATVSIDQVDREL